MIDVLHCVDQGVASHIVANVFWLFIKRKVFAPHLTQGQQVPKLYSAMQAHYKESKETSKIQGKLTVERIKTKGDWPKLKAKAAATRHLATFALHLIRKYGDGSLHDKRVLGVCQLLCGFYEIIRDEGMFFSAAAQTKMSKTGSSLCVLYSQLLKQARDNNDRMWKFSFKFYLFQHLCEYQSREFGNPRFYWTYADEDLIGIVIKIARKCHAKNMAETALHKWIVLTFAEFDE